MGHHGPFVTILVLCLSARAVLGCEDESAFLFKNKDGKDCDWVAKNSEKRCALETVSESCPAACDLCPCADDSEFSFRKGKSDCAWVAEKATPRCNKFAAARKNCRVTCGTCPTPAPTPAPTPTPTPAPTPAVCEDDPKFKHNNNKKKDCDWVASVSSTRCALGTASDSCPVACDLCPARTTRNSHSKAERTAPGLQRKRLSDA